MIEQDFHQRWSDRATRYPGSRPLPQGLTAHLHIDPWYAETYAGQVAAITAASLFGRMTTTVAVDAPSVAVSDTLPWRGTALNEVMMQTLEATHQFGRHEQRPAQGGDLRLVVGPEGDGLVIHGSGWSGYYGVERSPLPHSDEHNPFGAAFAVVSAAARVQEDPNQAPGEPGLLDVYRWGQGTAPPETPQVTPGFELGELWSIGVGSVGSCALFFLSLITRSFEAVLIDGDELEVENISRSALFSWRDAIAGKPKVEVAARWLREAGVERIKSRVVWLDEMSERWTDRRTGTPDLVISAANERNVRAQIESAYPPLQVYATTGRNWQTTLFRHIPLVDPCSCCVPGADTAAAPTLCATGSPTPVRDGREQDDVALPFLSYAAGLMTAAEITKLALVGNSSTPNRVFYEPGNRGFLRVPLSQTPACTCRRRDATTHQTAIAGSRLAHLSGQ